MVVEKAAGSYVYTTCGMLASNKFFLSLSGERVILFISGRKLLDFTSGIGVLNTGHCHPKIVKAAQDQVDQEKPLCSV